MNQTTSNLTFDIDQELNQHGSTVSFSFPEAPLNFWRDISPETILQHIKNDNSSIELLKSILKASFIMANISNMLIPTSDMTWDESLEPVDSVIRMPTVTRRRARIGKITKLLPLQTE